MGPSLALPRWAWHPASPARVLTLPVPRWAQLSASLARTLRGSSLALSLPSVVLPVGRRAIGHRCRPAVSRLRLSLPPPAARLRCRAAVDPGLAPRGRVTLCGLLPLFAGGSSPLGWRLVVALPWPVGRRRVAGSLLSFSYVCPSYLCLITGTASFRFSLSVCRSFAVVTSVAHYALPGFLGPVSALWRALSALCFPCRFSACLRFRFSARPRVGASWPRSRV
jgi:hypothetical protein